MPEFGTGINSLRSLVFVRNFGNQVVNKTSTRVQKDAGNIKMTAVDAEVSPRKLSFKASNTSILVRAEKNIQDTFIDIMA